MTINKFIKICSKKDGHLGHFAQDIIQFEDFPFIETNIEVLEIIENRAKRFGLIKVFKIEFEKSN